MIWMLPSNGSILDGVAMSSGAHHELEGFVPWMLVDVGPVAGQERPGVKRGVPGSQQAFIERDSS